MDDWQLWAAFITLPAAFALVFFIIGSKRAARWAYDEGFRDGERDGRRPSVERLRTLQLARDAAYAELKMCQEQLTQLHNKINEPQIFRGI